VTLSLPPTPVALAPSNMPSIADMNRAAADFEKRHPPLAIPAFFPQVVPFGLGKTDFPGPDTFTITEIHGTSNTFILGGVYQIKGTYNLTSHDQGTIHVGVTAKHNEDGIGKPQSCQGIDVTRGQGNFTLILPMRCEGWPHVTLHAGNINIADAYFGTGDTIWKP
jgi:hypothetical protein